ncbi:MAG: hypothetical protein KZQ65_11540, partial [Candidatus Thiodiazotropha sp. (ex Gloverina cf. vestifex)]|nr:hypothetical protein [Candidatus Thiodiazotropha sp. (ex Gloverina cf. vestifex)]
MKMSQSFSILLYLLLLFSAQCLSAVDEDMTILAGGSAESLYDTSVTDAEIVFTLVFNEVIKKSNERFKLKIQACRYLVKDFGTSESPKSTRQRDSRYAPT